MGRGKQVSLATLEGFSPAKLKEEWARRFNAPAPNISPALLQLGLGYRLQEQKLGGLGKEARSLLRQHAKAEVEPVTALLPRKLTIGTRLVRDWHGTGHTVAVLEKGFEYKGTTWRSLSAIAKAITGAHWNGPRFLSNRAELMKTLRCAVYTRKSTEDGLEQEFNSLHAQREACEAYILSQRHEGWSLVERAYDDGGFSGGSMQRPGLLALLKDVEAGLVDVIVVYKVDRLTRSLADFAKIVEQLDAKEASFVSVTQAFNTTTSMGRLTLNVLLSFAQFEREVTGERIRDKIAASKKKGLWMGGPVPLGYEVIERKLVPVAEEAERVRTIMQRYIASRSANALIAQLEAEGIRTKVQLRTSGPHRGGIPFKRGSLFHLLKNPIYRGKIVHKGTAYDGEHEAIVGQELWDQVQKRLKQKAPPRKRPKNDAQDAMLKGLLVDQQSRPMVPTYATKGSRRYAYYETRKDLARPNDAPATRIGQGPLERYLIMQLTALLEDEHGLRRLSGSTEANELSGMFETGRELAARLIIDELRRPTIAKLVLSIQFADDRLDIELDPTALGIEAANPWRWSISAPPRKPFGESKLQIDPAGKQAEPDPQLIKLLVDAKQVQELVLGSPELSLNQLGKREGRCRTQLAKYLRLSWLSPRIVKAILTGDQPAGLKRTRLLGCDLPSDWSAQERLLGFAT